MNLKITIFMAAIMIFSSQFLLAQNITAYSWKAGTYSGDICQGPLVLGIPDTEPVSLECYTDEDYYFLSGGEWINNKWYGVIYDTFGEDCPLITIDTLTGEVNTIGQVAPSVAGIAHDYSTGITYGISYGGAFFTIDITTGNYEVIGVATSQMIGLVCSLDGTIYALNNNDILYKINKSTGEETEIGSVGLDIGQVYTGMSFDRETNILYAFLYGLSSGETHLASIDIETGGATILNSYSENTLSSLAIPYIATEESHDLGIISVVPSETDAGLSINPSVFIENLGTATENEFTIEMVISDGANDVYSSTKQVTTPIMPNEQMEIELDDTWTPELVQSYTITTTLTLTDDEDISNNTLVSDCEVIVGVKQISKKTYSVYPIPSTGIITIDTQEVLLINIFNQQGKMIKTLNLNSKTEVDLSDYSKGLYFLKAIDSNGNSYTESILIE